MRFLLFVGAACAILCRVQPCVAQAMDYGGLEAMFGEPVTTSATGSPQRAADAPVAMEIITADDIRRSGANSIPEILRFVAGVDVRRYGVSDSDVGIRGYNEPNSPRVLVLVNGRQVYVDYYGYTAWPTLPVQLEEIRQIEVIKGPNSALYGFNAVGGVINIVTFDPIFDSVNEMTVRAGSRGEHQVSAVGTMHFGDRAGVRVSASEHQMSEWSVSQMPLTPVNNGTAPYSGQPHTWSTYVHGRATTRSGIEFSAEGDAGEAEQFEVTIGGWPATTSYAYNRQKFGVGGETPVGFVNLSGYRNFMRYNYYAGFNCVTCTSIDNTLYVLQLSDLMKPAADHAVRLGAEYRRNRAGGTIFPGEQIGFDLFAADAMWNWQITPELALTNSGRIDHMVTSFQGDVDPDVQYTASQYDGHSFTQPSYNSALVYKPTAVDTARLSTARAVQIPNLYDLFPEPVAGFQNPSLQGSPFLKPAIIMNYEVDYTRALPRILSTAQLALYHQTTRDFLALPGDAGMDSLLAAPSGQLDGSGKPETVAYPLNIGQSTANGGEVSLKGADPDGWRWKASYAYIFIKDHISVNRDLSNPADSSIDNQRQAPRSVVNFGLGRTWGPWEADVAGHWQSSWDDILVMSGNAANSLKPAYRVHIDDYLTMNARVGYSPIDNVTLAVTGEQLNHTVLRQTGAAPSERRILGVFTARY